MKMNFLNLIVKMETRFDTSDKRSRRWQQISILSTKSQLYSSWALITKDRTINTLERRQIDIS